MTSRKTFNLGFLAIVLSGCLGDEGSTAATATTSGPATMDLPAAAPLTRSEFCPAVADAFCLGRRTCCAERGRASCLEDVEDECRSLYAELLSSPAFEFDEARAGGLVELIRRDAEACRPSIMYYPMPHPGIVLSPALQEGDPCRDDVTAYGCVESTFCDWRLTGRCQPRKAVDMPCFRPEECEVGLACSFSDDGSAGHCVAPAGRGQFCRDRPCEDGLTCSAITRRCEADSAVGERCDDRPCERGLACVWPDEGVTDVPRCEWPLPDGSPCEHERSELCGPEALCIGMGADGRGVCSFDPETDYPAPRDGVCRSGFVLDSVGDEPTCAAYNAADAFCR
ncbi:hypothetical protein L6V77_28930 [Myxococcota bacterium]|nr:hypothetical protein [Myxococcota bacterium]